MLFLYNTWLLIVSFFMNECCFLRKQQTEFVIRLQPFVCHPSLEVHLRLSVHLKCQTSQIKSEINPMASFVLHNIIQLPIC